MIEDLKEEFNDLDFTYLIGGQTSFDVVPNVRLMFSYSYILIFTGGWRLSDGMKYDE